MNSLMWVGLIVRSCMPMVVVSGMCLIPLIIYVTVVLES